MTQTHIYSSFQPFSRLMFSTPMFSTDPNRVYMSDFGEVVAAVVGEVSTLLTINDSGKLAYFRSGGDECWTVISETHIYDDVCVFNGRPCAVDSTGRTVAVGSGPDMDVTVIAESVLGGDENEKFLVESEGGLFLVNKHLTSTGYDNVDDDDEEIFVDRFEWKKPVRFDVYRLNEKKKSWVEVESLGGRVLFLGVLCAFSASASDLGVLCGNCVIFEDLTLKDWVCVFSLDVGWIILLADLPDYSSLFNYSRLLKPPPD